MPFSRSARHPPIWARQPIYGDGEALITAFASEKGVPSLSFMGLAEAYVLSTFRDAGVNVRRITPALERLKQEVGLDYALASGHLYTDGVEVLFDYISDDKTIGILRESRTGQAVLRPVVNDQLRRLEWDAGEWPSRLALPAFPVAKVVIDVDRAYGRPFLLHGAARVEDLVGRWRGGDSISDIASDFGAPSNEVEDAIRVGIAARAA